MHARRLERAGGLRGKKRQRGVAVITALLLTTLSVTIVANMFWQQQVQVRAIENQQLQLQKQWILRSALDWASLVLREDIGNSTVDHAGEQWAAPMAATRLSDYLDKGSASGNITNAQLSGSIVDAQSRYNLRNLAPAGVVDTREVATLQRLLSAFAIDSRLARRIADLIAMSTSKNPDSSGSTGLDPVSAESERVMGIEQTEDVFMLAGRPEVFDKLKDFVVLLPTATPINVNTASAQVLAARLNALSADDVSALVASRDHAYIRDEGDLSLRLQGKSAVPPESEISMATNYFLINAKVRVNDASLGMQALVGRSLMTGQTMVWMREN